MKNIDRYDKITYLTQLDQLVEEYGINIVVDKLKLCYNVANDEIVKYLEEHKPDFFSLLEFDLVRIEGKHFEDIYQIVYNDLDKDNNLVPHVFGELKINLKSQSKDEEEQGVKRAWIYVNNYILYSRENQKLTHLPFISSKLGLLLNNVTGIEIAIDTKKNVPQRLKRNLRNKKITTILNGKTILDRKEDRPEIEYIHSGDMDRYKYMSIYLKQKKAVKNKSDGTTICSYDKVSECKNGYKDYILDYYNHPKRLYRLEVRVTNENFKKFLEASQIELTEQLFWSKGFLLEAFAYFLSSVIRFKSDGKNIPIWDILY